MAALTTSSAFSTPISRSVEDCVKRRIVQRRAFALAAYVERDCSVARRGNRFHPATSAAPSVGKAMREQHHRTLAHFHNMQRQTVGIDPMMLTPLSMLCMRLPIGHLLARWKRQADRVRIGCRTAAANADIRTGSAAW